MKRYVKAWYTGEPSGYEYGKALSEGYKRLQDRFDPFAIKPTYMTTGSANSDGYRITLYDTVEWILHKSGGTWDSHYDLYGPFDAGQIKTSGALYRSKDNKLGEFKGLDSAMSYLFKDGEVIDLMDAVESGY